MKKLIISIKSLLCPSVDETLSNFHQQINTLNKRVDLNVDEINHNNQLIEDLHKRNQVLQLDISKAESAVESLEKITG